MRDVRRVFYTLFGGFGLLILILNLLTPMVGDDYIYAFSFADDQRISSVMDIFPSLAAHMEGMNGRVVPHFFVQLFTMMPRWVFALVNTAVYLLFVFGAYRLCKNDEEYDILMLCVIEAGLFLGVPAFGQSFLWMSGAVNYLWCDLLLVLLLIPFARTIMQGDYRPGKWALILMPMAALGFGNMSENVSASGALMMGFCILYQLIRRRQIHWWMIATLVMSIAGWLLLMLAPANSQRVFGDQGSPLPNYDRAMAMFMENGLWQSAASVVLIVLAWCTPGFSKDRTAFAAGLFVCAIACNFAMIKADYYPERAFTGTFVMLVLSAAMLLPALKLKPNLSLALAIGLGFISAVNGVHAIRNNYDRYMLAQARANDMQIAAANGETEVNTYRIKYRSSYDAFYNSFELGYSPGDRVNICYARYYGLNDAIAERVE